ncbi:MAG TPA: hypothetical protein VGE37_05290 [Archangium sp.]
MDAIERETKAYGDHLCERSSMRAWHTQACARRLEDPGATCSCRPPRGDDISIDFDRRGVSTGETRGGASAPHPGGET